VLSCSVVCYQGVFVSFNVMYVCCQVVSVFCLVVSVCCQVVLCVVDRLSFVR